MSLLATLLLALGCLAAGGRLRGWLAWEGQEAPYRAGLQLTAGLVALFVGLLALDAVGIRWRSLALPLVLMALAAAAQGLSRSRPHRTPSVPWRPGWGDVVALLALLALAVCAVRLWIVYADFIYHWGIKGHRFYLAGGVDVDYLARPWNRGEIHPAYPQLLPALFAATALTAGAFAEPAMMAWSAIFFALLLAAARQALTATGVSAFGRHSTLSLVALVVAAFAIGNQMAGSPDWLLALAPLAAWPAMVAADKGRGTDLAVGVTAALAAAAKVEGLAMAAAVAAVYLAGRRGGRLRALPWVAGPVLAVAVPWLVQGLRHGLLAELGRGAWRPANAVAAWEGAYRAVVETGAWHGAGAFLLLLPLLWVPRATRPLAAVCTLQLAFYVAAYLRAPFADEAAVTTFARSNFARLLFHLVPALVVGGGVALDRWVNGAAPPSRAARAGASPAPPQEKPLRA